MIYPVPLVKKKNHLNIFHRFVEDFKSYIRMLLKTNNKLTLLFVYQFQALKSNAIIIRFLNI